VATTTAGRRVLFRLVQPEKTPANLAELARESKRWKDTALRFRNLSVGGALPLDVAKRAQFTDEVLATAAENLRLGITNAVIAQAEDGRVLGAAIYGFLPDEKAGTVTLVAIDPDHLAGSPGQEQLRGIGTAMVAAISREMLAKGVETVYLHPFDEAASTFWGHRGFASCGRGHLLCVRGRRAIERLIGACQMRPECPHCGDIVMCGQVEATIPARLPPARAMIAAAR
jgi:N-acetylglutamate synthase-like GNAT family acetyltransferase